MFVTKPNIKSIFNLSVLSLTITTPIRSFGSEQTNPRIPELTRAIEASVTELEGIAYPGQTAPLLRENNSRDQFSLSNLADRLDDVTNELEEQNQIEESRSYRRKCFINSYHFYCHKHRKSDAEIDESLQNKWLIYGLHFEEYFLTV